MINGKETIYTYDDILTSGGVLKGPNDIGNTNSDAEDNYSLYLYESDYYYRIEDYVTAENGGVINQVNENDVQPIIQNITEDDELKVFVTYKIVLNNQSALTNVKVNEVVDYFDSNYTYVSGSAKYGKYQNGSFTEIKTPTVTVNGGTQTIDSKTYKKLTITNLGENLGQAGQQIIYLTFEVNKDSTGAIILGEYDNIAEISSYSTGEGLIDKDSAPDNTLYSNTFRFEDDTDKANGIDIQTREEARSIDGTVWEDNQAFDSNEYKYGDGVYDEGNEINDVIVQLIELKDFTVGSKTYQFEYIWQQTRTGTDQVKSLVSNGTDTKDYQNKTSGTGTYNFTGFIPGNYIIRFIYGDGTYVDQVSTTQRAQYLENISKYNGQDYKSTTDTKYNVEYFSYTYNDNGTRNNDARDNESRRLEVMAYSALVDTGIGEALRDKTTLDETWMCAETSKINMSLEEYDYYIDEEYKEIGQLLNNNLLKILNDTDYEYKETSGIIGGISGSIYGHSIKSIDLGLEKRNVTKLELEKHLDQLKITLDGGGVILDTANNVVDMFTKIPSTGATREERGQWYFQTDTDELLRGATLEAIYRYTVKNTGEVDYLSSTLISKYESLTIANYKTELLRLAGEVKANIQLKNHTNSTYLGTTYYTGISNAGDVRKVESRAEILQETLNNELSFDKLASENNDTIEFIVVAENVERYIYPEDGTAATEQTINTVVQTKTRTYSLIPGENDNTKQILLTRILNNTEDNLSYDSYIAEIFTYSNAAGRRDETAVPGNLSYVHSDDVGRTLESEGNEYDEFWAETIKISKPTGENQSEILYIVITAIISIAIVAISIMCMKKFVLIKK